jgi:hypothetical protein
MNHSLTARIVTAAILLGLSSPLVGMSRGAPPAVPADQTNGGGPSDLGFLKIGHAYFIKFPDEWHPVLVRESGVFATPTGPSNWNAKYQIHVFVVKKLGRGSWALLEHPVDPKEALHVTGARLQLKDAEKIAKLEETEDGRKKLDQLREKAGRELKTTETWINLAHAISISDPPQTPENWKVDIQVKSISRK